MGNNSKRNTLINATLILILVLVAYKVFTVNNKNLVITTNSSNKTPSPTNPVWENVLNSQSTPTLIPQQYNNQIYNNSVPPTDTPTPTPESVYYYRTQPLIETPTPTPSGLQGNIQLNPDYTGGYQGYDSNSNHVNFHPDYNGGYEGQDSYGNQINLRPDYTGGYYIQNGSNLQHCNYNYVNGYSCN